jgi:hypothetical protein
MGAIRHHAIRNQQRSDVKNALHLSSTQPALWLAAIAVSSILALQMLFANHAVLISAPAVPVSQARLGPGTEGLLRQAALHLSKMESGKSVGGFPGFEPPKDDKEYQRKVRERAYNAQDVNDWVKQINNFLNQIVKKNPGVSLEKILQRQGSTQAQIDDSVAALREAYRIAESMEGFGVSKVTVETLKSVMIALGVSL